MRRHSLSVVLFILAALVSFALLARTAPADPTGVVVERANGLIVTVNTVGANVHFTYSTSCASNKPCYMIEVGQGAGGGVTASAASCTVQGNQYTPTVIQCPPSGIQSIQFKLVNGGTWSAYAGGGGQHAGGPCSPANVMVTTGSGSNSINTWDGCREVVYCDTGASGFAAVEADAIDTIRGHCNSIIKH